MQGLNVQSPVVQPVNLDMAMRAYQRSLAFPEAQLMAEKLTEDINKFIREQPSGGSWWSITDSFLDEADIENARIASNAVARQFRRAGYDVKVFENPNLGEAGQFYTHYSVEVSPKKEQPPIYDKEVTGNKPDEPVVDGQERGGELRASYFLKPW